MRRLSFSYHLDNLDIYEEYISGSLNEIERKFNLNVPFPEQLFLEEKYKETLEYKALTDENGNFSSLHFYLHQKEVTMLLLQIMLMQRRLFRRGNRWHWD